jgi:hypothetical protein
MSGHSEGTGRRHVWNSPELIPCEESAGNKESDVLKEHPLPFQNQTIAIETHVVRTTFECTVRRYM